MRGRPLTKQPMSVVVNKQTTPKANNTSVSSPERHKIMAAVRRVQPILTLGLHSPEPVLWRALDHELQGFHTRGRQICLYTMIAVSASTDQTTASAPALGADPQDKQQQLSGVTGSKADGHQLSNFTSQYAATKRDIPISAMRSKYTIKKLPAISEPSNALAHTSSVVASTASTTVVSNTPLRNVVLSSSSEQSRQQSSIVAWPPVERAKSAQFYDTGCHSGQKYTYISHRLRCRARDTRDQCWCKGIGGDDVRL